MDKEPKKGSVYFVLVCILFCDAIASGDSIRGRYDATKYLEDAAGTIGEEYLGGDLQQLRGLSSPIPIKILSDCSGDETWSGHAFDANLAVLGYQSVKLVAVNGGTDTVYYDLIGPDSAGNDQIPIESTVGIWLYTDTLDEIDRIDFRLYIDRDSNNTAYYYDILFLSSEPRRGLPEGAWWYVFVSPEMLVATGGAPDTWTANSGEVDIGDFAIYLDAVAGEDANLWVGGIIEEDFPKAAVCLGFDGPYDTNETPAGIALMDAYGWRGCLYTTCYTIYNNETGKMDLSEIQHYYNKGWDVIAHNWVTQFTAESTVAEVRQDLSAAREWMLQCGFHRSAIIGSPLGHAGTCVSADARAVAAEFYVASRYRWRADALYGTSNSGFPVEGFGNGKPWILPDYYQISVRSWHDSTEVQNKAWIDWLVATKGFGNAFTHELKDPPDEDNDITYAHFKSLCDYIKAYEAQGRLEVITLTDYLNRTLLRPGWNVGNGKTYGGRLYRPDPNSPIGKPLY